MISGGIKGWLIAACVLILAGGLLFCGVMSCIGWDFSRLATVKYETKRYEISEEFDSIEILDNTADILFLPSKDGKAAVECAESESCTYLVTVEDGTLRVARQEEDGRPWWEMIAITAGEAAVTVYLPSDAYLALAVTLSTGDVTVSGDFRFESIDIAVTTGDVVCRASAERLKLAASTGDITLFDVTAGEIALTTSTGDITVSGCDAERIELVTGTGDVEGTLLTPKIFDAQSRTGDVCLPENGNGGTCRIRTKTGDIDIRLH